MRRILTPAALAGLALLASPPACGGEPEDACRSNADCRPDAFCPVHLCLTATGACGSCPPSQCEPRRGENERCAFLMPSGEKDRACIPGLVCNGAAGALCTPPQPPGGPCGEDGDCAGSGSPGGTYCMPLNPRIRSDEGSCVEAGGLGAGEPCPVERACGPDLTCSGVCLPALREGEPCRGVPEACADGLACRDEVCTR